MCDIIGAHVEQAYSRIGLVMDLQVWMIVSFFPNNGSVRSVVSMIFWLRDFMHSTGSGVKNDHCVLLEPIMRLLLVTQKVIEFR